MVTLKTHIYHTMVFVNGELVAIVGPRNTDAWRKVAELIGMEWEVPF